MKILFLTTSFPRFQGDGTAPFIKSIADGLVTNGNEVIILAPFDKAVDNTFHPSRLEIHRFKYFPFKIMAYNGTCSSNDL